MRTSAIAVNLATRALARLEEQPFLNTLCLTYQCTKMVQKLSKSEELARKGT